jgi:hypothetical protein
VLVPPVLVVVVLRSRFLCDQQNEDDDNYEDDQATPASRPPIVGFFAISRTRTTTTTRTIRQFPRLAPQSSVSSPSAERGRRRPRGRSGNSRVSPPQSSVSLRSAERGRRRPRGRSGNSRVSPPNRRRRSRSLFNSSFLQFFNRARARPRARYRSLGWQVKKRRQDKHEALARASWNDPTEEPHVMRQVNAGKPGSDEALP